MIKGGIGDKPGMIGTAKIFCRPGLAGYLDGESGKQGTGCPRFFRNVAHPFPDQVQGGFGNRQRSHLFRCKNLIGRAIEIVDAADQEWFVLDAAIGDFTDNHGSLQGGNQLEPLSDCRVECIAEIPVLIEILLLIFFTGNQPCRFTAQGNTRFFTHAEHAGIFGQFIDADTTP